MTSEKEKMLRGERYDASDPELVAERERARHLTRRYNRTAPNELDQRRRLLDELFGSIEGDAFIEPPFRCDYGSNGHVDENFYANFDCVVLDVCRVEFGRDCLLGPGIHVYTATHPLPAEERTAGLEYGKPVTVGDDVWIGGRAGGAQSRRLGGGRRRDRLRRGRHRGRSPGVVVQGNPAEVVTELD